MLPEDYAAFLAFVLVLFAGLVALTGAFVIRIKTNERGRHPVG